MVQNILVSGGVTVTNVSYTGDPLAIGSFSTGVTATSLGIANGIVLTTGNLSLAPVIGSAASGDASSPNSGGSDPQLATLIAQSINNAAVLEFDFIPISDTLKFRYVFASEEYPDYVCSTYNDVFGFFLSQANPPMGGPYTYTNIAKIPGTNLPVTINSINSGTPGNGCLDWLGFPTQCDGADCISLSYSGYFVNNAGTGGTSIVYNGFTTVFTAWSLVSHCQTYHLKIAIGDAADDVLDSGVFLEANSFSGGSTPAISANQSICFGEADTIAVTNAPITASYLWSSNPSDTSLTDSTLATIIVSPTITTTYTCVTTGIVTCLPGDTMKTVVTVMNCIPITLNAIGTINTICGGTGCNYSGPSILINEVMLEPNTNDGCIYGTFSGGACEGEWIELYNPNKCDPVDISCYYLGNNAPDDALNPAGAGFTLPVNTIVPPMGFVIVRGLNAPAVPVNQLVQNGGKTIEIIVNDPNRVCMSTGSRLWFPNAGGWFAFYDNNGIPQDAIQWASTTNSDLSGNPCVASGTGCAFGGTLPSYNAIPAANKTAISTVIPTLGRSFRRNPDGGAWDLSNAVSPTYGSENGIPNPPPVVTCNGMAVVTPQGGNPPFTYIWNDTQHQTNDTAIGLCGGVYCVTVTDILGGFGTACVTVTDFVPVVTFPGPLADVCTADSSFLISGGQPSGGTYSGNGVYNGIFYPDTVAPGMYNIIYTWSDSVSCIGSDTTTITVYETPSSAFISIPATLCARDTAVVSYTGTQLVGATYIWDFAGGTAITGGTGPGPHKVIWATGGSKPITLTVQTSHCTSALTTVTVNIKPLPESIFDIISTPTCVGQSVSITSTGTAIPGSTYFWNFSGGTANPGIGAGPHTVTWNTAGTKTVTLTISAAGCISDMTSLPVVVNLMPISSFSANPTTVCTGQASNVLFTGTAVSGANYNWDFAGGIATPGTGAGPHAVIWTTTGIKNITLNVVANGCSSDTTSIPITVNLLPTSQFLINPSPMCYGDTAEVTYVGTAGVNSTFQWNFGGGVAVPSGGQGPFNVTWSTYGSKSVSLIVQETAQCISPATTIGLNVNPLPSPNFTVTTPVCAQSTSNITYVGNANDTTSVFDWNMFVGGEVLSGAGLGPYQVKWVTAGVKPIHLIVTDINGCENDTTIDVVVKPKPVINVTADKTDGCDPMLVQFTNHTTPSVNNIQWSFGDGASSTSPHNNPTHNYSIGIYDVTVFVTDSNGCTSTQTFAHMINVHAMPDAQYEVTPETAGPNFPVQFNSTSTGNIENYLWNYGDNRPSINNAYTEHPYTTSGTYTTWLTVVTDWNCRDSVSKEVKIIDITIPNVFTPNGDGKNDLWIIKGNEYLENTSVIIYNRWGKKVYESSNYKNDWDGGNSADGVYYFIVNFKNDMFKSLTGFVTILSN